VMAYQILLNFIISFLWLFLNNDYHVSTFFIGYILGLGIIFALRRFFNNRFYFRNIIAVIKLILIFLKELILSNIEIFKIIIRPKLNINPGIFALPTELKRDWEITVLANLITLTPGTLVVDISDDKKILYIHAMDIKDVDEAIHSIKNSFEKAIMEVSR
jgi:multicomponent Na+:H+ antiporter subunit E